MGFLHCLRLCNGQRFDAIPSTGTQGITGAEWKWVSTGPSHAIPVPKSEGSLPEPAAPSSCHRGDAPGSAGPLSSAKTPTEHSQNRRIPADTTANDVGNGLLCFWWAGMTRDQKSSIYATLQPKLGLLPRTWSPPWMGSYWTVCVCVHISTAAQTAWLRIGSDCLSLHSASHLSIASNPSSSQEKTSEIAHYYALLISALWNTTHFHRAFTLFKLCFNPGLLAVQAEGWQHSSGARDDGGNQDLDISPPQNILWTWQHWFLSNSVLNSEQKAAHRGSRRYCEQHTLSCMGTRTGAMQQHA